MTIDHAPLSTRSTVPTYERGVYSCHAWPWSYDYRPSHPCKAGTEYAWFSPTRQTTSLAPSAERREVLGPVSVFGDPWMPPTIPRSHFPLSLSLTLAYSLLLFLFPSPSYNPLAALCFCSSGSVLLCHPLPPPPPPSFPKP